MNKIDRQHCLQRGLRYTVFLAADTVSAVLVDKELARDYVLNGIVR